MIASFLRLSLLIVKITGVSDIVLHVVLTLNNFWATFIIKKWQT